MDGLVNCDAYSSIDINDSEMLAWITNAQFDTRSKQETSYHYCLNELYFVFPAECDWTPKNG